MFKNKCLTTYYKFGMSIIIYYTVQFEISNYQDLISHHRDRQCIQKDIVTSIILDFVDEQLLGFILPYSSFPCR